MTMDRNHMMSLNFPLTSCGYLLPQHSSMENILPSPFPCICIVSWRFFHPCYFVIPLSMNRGSCLQYFQWERKCCYKSLLSIILLKKGKVSHIKRISHQVIAKVIDLKTCICSTDTVQQLMWKTLLSEWWETRVSTIWTLNIILRRK